MKDIHESPVWHQSGIMHSSYFTTSNIVNLCSLFGVQNKSAIANQQSAIANPSHIVNRCSLLGVQGGSSRIGMLTQPEELDESPSGPVAFSQTLGNKVYEFSNHLGNVLTTFSDRKIAIESISDIGYVAYYTSEILSSTDYYPFGFQMPGRVYEGDYRYGFNSMEKDDELKGSGNSYDFGARIYDPRVGRWLAVDPQFYNYPSHSDYSFALSNPTYFIDKDGAYIVDKEGNIVKFRVRRNGKVKFKSPVDAYTKRVIVAMAQTEASKEVLISIRDNIEIKVSYIEATSEIVDLYQKEQNVTLTGVAIPKEEYELVVSKIAETITQQEYDANRLDLKKRRYFECDNCDKFILMKAPEVYSEQVILVNESAIKSSDDPEKEFLLTVTEESIHAMQDYVEVPTSIKNLTEAQYKNLRHEKTVQPTLKQVSDQYEEKKNKQDNKKNNPKKKVENEKKKS